MNVCYSLGKSCILSKKCEYITHIAHKKWANIGKLRSDTVGQLSEMSALPIVPQLTICQQ